MVRTIGEFSATRKPQKMRKWDPAPPRGCHYCGRMLTKGMGVRFGEGFRCRRPCSLWPVTGHPDE